MNEQVFIGRRICVYSGVPVNSSALRSHGRGWLNHVGEKWNMEEENLRKSVKNVEVTT